MTRHYAYYCPILACRAPMVRRTNKASGREFYGCSRWPDCAGTIEIPERERMIELGAQPLPGFETTEGES